MLDSPELEFYFTKMKAHLNHILSIDTYPYYKKPFQCFYLINSMTCISMKSILPVCLCAIARKFYNKRISINSISDAQWQTLAHQRLKFSIFKLDTFKKNVLLQFSFYFDFLQLLPVFCYSLVFAFNKRNFIHLINRYENSYSHFLII